MSEITLMSYNWKLEMIECKLFDIEIIMLVITSIQDMY